MRIKPGADPMDPGHFAHSKTQKYPESQRKGEAGRSFRDRRRVGAVNYTNVPLLLDF